MAKVYVRPNVNVEDPRNQRAAHAQKSDSCLIRCVQKLQMRKILLICVLSDYLRIILHLFVLGT